MLTQNLSQKIALVTGASRGIGAAIADRLPLASAWHNGRGMAACCKSLKKTASKI